MSTDEALRHDVMARWDDTPEPERRIRWGDLPNQTMPAEWAEQFIRIVYADHPGVFRAILPRLYGLPADAPKRTRRQQ